MPALRHGAAGSRGFHFRHRRRLHRAQRRGVLPSGLEWPRPPARLVFRRRGAWGRSPRHRRELLDSGAVPHVGTVPQGETGALFRHVRFRRTPQRPFDAALSKRAAALFRHRILELPREAALQPPDERMAFLSQEHRLGVPPAQDQGLHRPTPCCHRLRAHAHDPHGDLPRSRFAPRGRGTPAPRGLARVRVFDDRRRLLSPHA